MIEEVKVKYCIGRPIEGISLNGNEYLLDGKGNVMTFEDYNACIAYVSENITDVNPEDYVWEEDFYNN
tara:strand:- start:485 stop:688 length:204 start_codon:yes stop_codon:yes gene_type:complete